MDSTPRGAPALPDDVLRLILRRLDTRSALATAALSKHWSRLPRHIPVLEFKRYRRYLRRRVDAGLDDRGQHDSTCDRPVRAPGHAFLGQRRNKLARRSAQAMALELLPTNNYAPFNRLMAKAVGDWGVQDLAIVVLKQPTPPCEDDVSYGFPHHCFEGDSKSSTGFGSSLRRLRLSKCAPLASGGRSRTPPPAAFSSLTVLILQDMPRTVRGRVYRRVIRACPMLEVLHLKSCLTRARICFDTQTSRVKELVIDQCTFISVHVRSLMPDQIHSTLPSSAHEMRILLSISRALSHFSALESLVVRFSGPEMWIVPDLLAPLVGEVLRLVADLPRSWDISWTCRLLEAAPFLETLHVHVTNHDSRVGYGPPSGFRHGALREVVILGFEGTETQLHFVSFLRDAPNQHATAGPLHTHVFSRLRSTCNDCTKHPCMHVSSFPSPVFRRLPTPVPAGSYHGHPTMKLL
ncbi:hypothetical protein HU200_003662 [Digitaria exilis]|uniref:F-box domain-containing protein n=1 Tax=Digitaria exilis TaxID=1010633 RepID=A0A835KUF1_9POAL|nr:hypothetical protein HU200_003662 [Digitaria exilis]